MGQQARQLRKPQTPAEKQMWELLRDRRLRGLKFRRQFPIGPFIADFCCYELRLVIELDGEIHTDAQNLARDRERDAYIRGTGYTVLRFPNRLLFANPAGVLAQILEAAQRKAWVE